MRLTLNNDEAKLVQLAVLKAYREDSELYINIAKQLDREKNRDISKKQKSANNANKVKSEIAIKKIENTVNLMRLENKKININSVSNESKVAYNTVKKYLKDII